MIRFCHPILQQLRMNPQRILSVCQISDEVEELTIKNNTTKSPCGYIVCAMCEFLAEQESVTPDRLKQIDFFTLKPYIEKVMQTIAKSRRMEVKKFMTKMNEGQKKSYMTDWVANFQIADYLSNIIEKSVNPFLYFFRQVAQDHPEAVSLAKWEQAERIKEQQEFKGQKYFYTSFNPTQHHRMQEFMLQVAKNQGSGLPMIIATDVLGHFNTCVILEGQSYILDSLPYVEGQYDNDIHEAIGYLYRESFLK